MTEQAIKRQQRKVPLGFCDKMTMKQAKAAKQQTVAPINAGKFMLPSQVHFDVVVQKFLDARLPQLAAASHQGIAPIGAHLNARIDWATLKSVAETKNRGRRVPGVFTNSCARRRELPKDQTIGSYRMYIPPLTSSTCPVI